MNYDELVQNFSEGQIKRCVYINPLVVAEDMEFNKKKMTQSYQERALDFVTKNCLPFSSTHNSFWNIFKRYLKVLCPYCDEYMDYNNGGGSANFVHIDYKCSCGGKFSIGCNWDSISFER